jgi:hypothetical protein
MTKDQMTNGPMAKGQMTNVLVATYESLFLFAIN